MADFVAVLRKTIGALGDNTPEMREMVYQKARTTIEAKLAAINPPPPAAVADRQRKALEDAIAVLRSEYEPPSAAPDDDLEDILASLNADPAPPARPAPTAPPPPSVTTEPEPAAAPQGRETAAPVRQPDVEQTGPVERASDPVAELDAVSAAPEPRRPADPAARRPPAGPRRSRLGLVAALVVLLALAGGSYAIWLNKDDFSSLIGSAPATVEPASEDVAAAPAQEEPAAAEDATTPPEPATGETAQEEQAAAAEPQPAQDQEQEQTANRPAANQVEKFTQRLLPDGSEVDAGPAGGERTLGEGTSVASAVQPQPDAQATTGPEAEPAPAAEAGAQTPAESQAQATPAVAVGQRAIFYEERTSSAQGSAESGTIVWSIVQESPGGDLPPEPAIRAEATIPGKEVQLRMTIRRNGDQTLPAAHIVEMIFLTPDNFEGGSISNVSRIAFKDTEQATGNPLLGIPAKIADGFFLIALGDSPAEIEANLTLLRRESWVDIPIVYQSGRRALLSLEKGIPGDRIFQDVLRSWSEADSSG